MAKELGLGKTEVTHDTVDQEELAPDAAGHEGSVSDNIGQGESVHDAAKETLESDLRALEELEESMQEGLRNVSEGNRRLGGPCLWDGAVDGRA